MNWVGGWSCFEEIFKKILIFLSRREGTKSSAIHTRNLTNLEPALGSRAVWNQTGALTRSSRCGQGIEMEQERRHGDSLYGAFNGGAQTVGKFERKLFYLAAMPQVRCLGNIHREDSNKRNSRTNANYPHCLENIEH